MAKDSAAAQVVAIRDEAPDFTKAINLEYWALSQGDSFGILTNRVATVGGTYADGFVQGKVEAIQKLPDGSVVITVQQGWQPGKLEGEQNMRKRYVVCVGSCHGVMP